MLFADVKKLDEIDQRFCSFLVKQCFRSFYLITVWLCNFLAKENRRKNFRKMLLKLALPRVNFINIFTYEFFVRMSFQQLFYIHVTRKIRQNDIRTKNARV